MSNMSDLPIIPGCLCLITAGVNAGNSCIAETTVTTGEIIHGFRVSDRVNGYWFITGTTITAQIQNRKSNKITNRQIGCAVIDEKFLIRIDGFNKDSTKTNEQKLTAVNEV
jgi:hypothetical protein